MLHIVVEIAFPSLLPFSFEAAGAGVGASTGSPEAGGAPAAATIGWPSGPITGAGMALASGPA
jgi:hypothetical protein